MKRTRREEVKKMRKMLSMGLVLVMACSFVLLGQRRADAMDNSSAAILAGTMAIIGGAMIGAIANDAYAADHEVRTKIIYDRSRYKSCDRPYRAWYKERERSVYERGRQHDGWRR
jgi:hypothetical protein